MRQGAKIVLGLLLLAFAVAHAGAEERPVFIGGDDWTAALRAHGVDPAILDNPIAATPQMARAAREYAGRGDASDRLGRIQDALFDPDTYTFEYAAARTLTAVEAFEQRRGNCVSFVNLFIALARTQGIPVRPALLRSVREIEIEGDLMVVNTHLVAAYPTPGGETDIFDFYRSRADTPVKARMLDDMDLNAIYLNNLGVESLREGDLEGAVANLEAAVALSPKLAAAYANLGVARRRAGDEQGALTAYFDGLAVAPNHPRLLHNLMSLYRARAVESGAAPDRRPVGSERVTPREILSRADDELARGDAERALQLYKRAHRMDRSLSAPLVGIARMQILEGRLKSARRTLDKALEVDPNDEGARELWVYLEKHAP
jgi:tetratricopeptide (TPR) repeat protein